MARTAIVSRHLTLGKSRHPLYGVVLVEGDVIFDVVVVDDSIPVSAMLEKYSDWNPQNFEDLYVCPGLIDCNVRSNGPWEGRACMTRAAVSGGVTLVVEEPNLYALEEHDDAELCCDVGKSFVVQASNFRDLPEALSRGVLAVKGYLSPPSGYTDSVEPVLPEVLEILSPGRIPFFIDPSEPNRRHLFMSSPCRYKPLEERKAFDGSKGSNFFAGAFPDEAEDSDQEEELTSSDRINRTISDAGMFEAGVTKFDASPMPQAARQSTMVTGTKHLQAPPPPSTDIYKDLDKRIKKSSSTTEDLANLEYSGYQAEGPTTYEPPPKRRSSSFTVAKVLTDEVPKDRLQGFRPAALAIRKVEDSQPEQREDEYLFYLANCPDKWERKGVEQVVGMLPYTPCKVHFTNLSSANAVNFVRNYRDESKDSGVTCETCPHYLYWASDRVEDGRTILKAAPAIRNRANKQLLWELLKVKAIDMISSHHTPVLPEYKFPESGNFRKALPGITGLGFSLQAVWTRLMEESPSREEQEHYLVRLSKWMSTAPAKLLGLSPQRGSIEKGKFADLVVWAPRDLCTQDSLSKYPELNPYCEEALFGRVHAVYVRGRLAFQQGQCFPVGRIELKVNSYSQ